MTRDPNRPIEVRPYKIPRSECGYALEDHGDTHCGQPSAYRFQMESWPSWRTGVTCPEHALIVRRWEGVAWMRSLVAVQ